MSSMENIQLVNFWCDETRQDITSPASLVWLNSRVGEVWMGTSANGKRLIRLRDEHALLDPYFKKSLLIKKQILKHKDDLIQFNDPCFNLKYPQHKRDREKRLEKNELSKTI